MLPPCLLRAQEIYDTARYDIAMLRFLPLIDFAAIAGVAIHTRDALAMPLLFCCLLIC